MKRVIAPYLMLLIACSPTARAQADAEPVAIDPSADASTGAVGADGDGQALDDEFDVDASRVPQDGEVAAATARVDAALDAAKGRGEMDRLAAAQQRNELDAVGAELDARLASIAALEGRIDEMLGAGKVEREHRRERVDLLANLIATMSPQAAATMLAQMSDAQAQDLLFSVAQSDKRKAAKLIATMPPSRAAAIGQRYLTRDPAAPQLPSSTSDPLPVPELDPPNVDESAPQGDPTAAEPKL